MHITLPWSLASTYERAATDAPRRITRPELVSDADLAALPSPVASYLRRVGVVRRPRFDNFRAVFRTSNWDDFVHLSFTEIRHCGKGSIQIVRRLRSMLQVLIQTLPEHRHPALVRELDLLDREAAEHYRYPEDLELARIPDSQGMGAGRMNHAG